VTLPTPIPAPAPPVAPSVGLLTRLKLTEPVRLYLYSVALVLLGGLNLAGYLTGQWQDFAAASAAVLLGIGAAGESARASVYSTRSVVQAVRRAGQQ
jgi:hypothetical protein